MSYILIIVIYISGFNSYAATSAEFYTAAACEAAARVATEHWSPRHVDYVCVPKDGK